MSAAYALVWGELSCGQYLCWLLSQHRASRIILQHIPAPFSAALCEPRRWIPLDSEKGIEVSVLPQCRLKTYCRLSCCHRIE